MCRGAVFTRVALDVGQLDRRHGWPETGLGWVLTRMMREESDVTTVEKAEAKCTGGIARRRKPVAARIDLNILSSCARTTKVERGAIRWTEQNAFHSEFFGEPLVSTNFIGV